MIPSKLKNGDEIRIVSPSMSLSVITKDSIEIATERLKKMGFKITYGKNAEETDESLSSSIKSRVQDINDAFKDKNVKCVMATIGGFNSNQLLKYLDYDLIKSNPKIFCGYSDITALQNAIYKKTGLVTYSGPCFSNFGMLNGIDYTIEYFKKCLIDTSPFKINPSEKWSNDKWWENQQERNFVDNKGFKGINDGKAEGTIVGANLCTFNLLQGTEFMPSLKDSILFIEDDGESKAHHFDRDLQSLIHLPEFNGVKGIVIGRFQNTSEITDEKLIKIIKTKKELDNIPIISNVDFGHTTPHITFPIGGKAKISVKTGNIKMEVLEH
ncbi:MAG: LD-carboxypeptidase [Candidatus Nanoarchaeia archaeon]|nr:LD-carboxypeptidase [Candidatus Nanoarchaeia archaeon]